MKKSFRILVTERCNASCPTCFNSDARRNIEMSLSDFKRLSDYLSEDSGVETIKLMGGEPTTHSKFNELYTYAQEKFKSVHLFTNALNDELYKLNLRTNDFIIYNMDFLKSKNFSISKLRLDVPGNRILETQISHGMNVSLLLSSFDFIFSQTSSSLIPSLTLNCVENIFKYRKELIVKSNKIIQYLEDKNIEYIIDHNIPLCFFIGTDMKLNKTDKCSVDCAGLITSDLQLKFCNQTNKIISKLETNKKDNFIPFKEVIRILEDSFLEKMEFNQNKICRDCKFFDVSCNGGCFMHKDFITKEDVINSVLEDV